MDRSWAYIQDEGSRKEGKVITMVMFRIYGLRFHPLRPYVRSVHYRPQRPGRNSLLELYIVYVHSFLTHKHTLSLIAAATTHVSPSGNGARYLQRVIRKAAAAAAAAAPCRPVHVFIRFPIKREIFQF